MLVPSVRALDVAHGEATLDLTLTVDGVPVGAGLKGAPSAPDETADGASVVWDSLVALQVDLCCVACRSAVLSAHLTDANDREFGGSVEVLLVRNGVCPDPSYCCRDVGACPGGLLPQLCPP